MRRLVSFVLLAAVQAAIAQSTDTPPIDRCAEALTIEGHGGTTTRYAFAEARGGSSEQRMALVMLIGGSGVIDLDDKGCPQRLNRNSLVRMSPLLRDGGVATVLVDAPSDLRGDEGLGGFRVGAGHAQDLGRVIAAVRARTQGKVWIAGHSRGTISAANAAARLTGPSAPDGVVLMSPMLVGDAKARKSWVAQTVLSVDLEDVKAPLLVVGHAADNCVRSPAALMGNITAKTPGARRQLFAVTGGPIAPGRPPGVAACEVGEPHDFVDQEAEVAAGILRFMRGGSY